MGGGEGAAAESLRDRRGTTSPSDAPEQMETGLSHWYTDGGSKALGTDLSSPLRSQLREQAVRKTWRVGSKTLPEATLLKALAWWFLLPSPLLRHFKTKRWEDRKKKKGKNNLLLQYPIPETLKKNIACI